MTDWRMRALRPLRLGPSRMAKTPFRHQLMAPVFGPVNSDTGLETGATKGRLATLPSEHFPHESQSCRSASFARRVPHS